MLLKRESWGYEPRHALVNLRLNVEGKLGGFRFGGWGYGDIERCEEFKWNGVDIGLSVRSDEALNDSMKVWKMKGKVE